MRPRFLLSCLFGAAAVPSVPAAEAIRTWPAPYPTFGEVERLDPAMDALLPRGAVLEKLAEGFNWSEGPVWVPRESHLLFSDVPEDVVYRWKEGADVTVFLTPSGFTGERYEGREQGSNGLTLDATGRLILAQHGDRRIARLNPDGRTFTTVTARWEGKRFNSPNDLCYDRAGNLYFTDPPYGLPRNATRDIEFQGVYRLNAAGEVVLLVDDLERPNGIALSPDERTLYVANSHPPRPIIMAYSLDKDGKIVDRRVLFDAAPLAAQGRRGLPDGLKVDQRGNLWATGPGGVLIISPDGRHLGSILTGRATANCAFGGDGSVLYITADDVLARIQTSVHGTGF